MLRLLVFFLVFSSLWAQGLRGFVEDMEAEKGFDQAMLNLTGHEVGFMLGAIIASSGKVCDEKPTQWLVLGTDSAGTALVSVRCKVGPSDLLLSIPQGCGWPGFGGFL